MVIRYGRDFLDKYFPLKDLVGKILVEFLKLKMVLLNSLKTK